MELSKIVGQKVITADGVTLTIMNLEGQYLQLSNGKLYSFELAYHNGFIKFKDEAMQKEVKEHFEETSKKKEEAILKQKELEEKFLKEEMEKRRKRLEAQAPQKPAKKNTKRA
ncbi:MAG: hypothetical protein K6G74_01790 [Bacilli bacterium]|nr:hypothetical protein [Bacilli bacterium]